MQLLVFSPCCMWYGNLSLIAPAFPYRVEVESRSRCIHDTCMGIDNKHKVSNKNKIVSVHH